MLLLIPAPPLNNAHPGGLFETKIKLMDSKQAFELYPRQVEDITNVDYIKRVANLSGLNYRSLETHFYRHLRQEVDTIILNSGSDNLYENVKSKIRNKKIKIEDLANEFNVPPYKIREVIKELKDACYNIEEEDESIEISSFLKEGERHSLDESMWQGDKLIFGFASDQHLCSHFERLDVLNLLYDIYASEGISIVLNCGNWIDGEARFNKNEIHTRGLTKQIEYAIKVYPYRAGIKTWFIAGDDHEGWYSQREGINIGEYFEMKRKKSGKNDLEYKGYIEADIELNKGGFEQEAWIRLMHPGGGTAYAISYTPQKIIEALQGGEKPAVLFLGHYHKMSYNYIRNVHTIQCGTVQDQSIYMRKKKIGAHVGGGIITLRRARDGTINRINTEFITVFDRKFYIGKNKYWK